MNASTLHALVISHVGFEDLGSLQQPLIEHGFTINSIEVATTEFPFAKARQCDLLIVLGGPIGVYEQTEYPFLKHEIAAIAERLETCRPILGICLGAQLMAAALGSDVYPGGNGKEIGWAPISGVPGIKPPSWFQPLLAPDLHLLHWHGDTFDLPAGAALIASTEHYCNQAFIVNSSSLGLQFHPEVQVNALESWYVGHAAELHQAGISIPALRASAERHGPRLEIAAREFFNQWLDYIL
jgi:GMP synthase - Glutamine amidotransferase domain